MGGRRMNDPQLTTEHADPGIRFVGNANQALNTAIALGAMGLPCFPSAPNNHPACPHDFQDAATDPIELRELWDRVPGELVRVRTGESSGIDVLDLDPKQDEAWEWCKANQRRFPRTRTHKTPWGGVHLLFRHKHGLRCSARIVPGIEVHANDGSFIWWPATGFPVLRPAPLADWPQWLLDDLAPLLKSPPPAGSTEVIR
jgi:Bifunctional DNA primase/polymerase, N-terminal